MAQRSCCVPGCSMKLGGGLPLHRFPNPNNPAQVERFRTWVMKIGGDIIGEDNNFIHKNRKVCHKHFQDIYILPNKKITALAIPTLAIPGVHVAESTHIELPSTSLQMETAISIRPVPMDKDISSRPVMNIEMPVQLETAISTRPVQMDTAISSRPVINIAHNRSKLLSKLVSLKLEQFTHMRDYVTALMSVAQQLRDIGKEVDDELLAALMLQGLPEEYNPMRLALENTNIELTTDYVKTKLLQLDQGTSCKNSSNSTRVASDSEDEESESEKVCSEE